MRRNAITGGAGPGRVLLLCTLLLGLCPLTALALPAAAHVQTAIRDARAISPNQPSRALQRGDAVYSGDSLVTGKRSYLALRFSDHSVLRLGENSEFHIDAYAVDPDGPMALRIGKGLFRFVTGLMSKRRKEQFRLRGLVASIGIRGTDFAGEFVGEQARIILLEGEAERPGAIVVFNDFGSVEIDQASFGTEIPDARSPPSQPQRMRLEALQRLMRSLNQVQRLSPRR